MRTTIDPSTARAARLDTSGIDFDAFVHTPLSPDGLRCLRYMHDVEHHTVCYLRDLLLTPAHRDPTVTSFLACWAYEELWHGEAIAEVLAAHREPAGRRRVAALRRGRRWRDLVGVVSHLGLSTLAGDSFVALQMAWGAINEWTTQAGYARLAAVEGHPTLSELLRRIMRQEGRHIDFYSSEARRRLAHDMGAQRLARQALRYLWKPVGSGVMPAGEVRFLGAHLFSGPDGMAMARRIDRRVDGLPGLAGLHLLASAVAGDQGSDSTALRTDRARSSDPRSTRSSGWWASRGSPGPKLAAGTPCAQKEATSVQPTLA